MHLIHFNIQSKFGSKILIFLDFKWQIVSKEEKLFMLIDPDCIVQRALELQVDYTNFYGMSQITL